MSVRAAVTGLGALTPLAGDTRRTWEAVLAARSGVRPLDREWAAELPVRIAATIQSDPADVVGERRARTLDRVQQLACAASAEAWADAGAPDVDPQRLAVVIGSGIGGILSLLGAEHRREERGARGVSPHAVPMLMANGPAAAVGLDLGARGGVHAPVSACASGAEAIALALSLIRADRADVVVCGGAEAAVHPLPIAAFAAMRALSTRNDEPQFASRPFDKARDGFVLGEGAAVLVLESVAHAAARDARVYAHVAGAGMTSDAHHIAAPHPAGEGAAEAMRAAMSDAGVAPGDVVHVNAHATSTPLGDVAESLAIRASLGDVVDQCPVTATKSVTGHLLGAAGALEAVLTVLALHHRLAPPIANLDDPDDEVRLDLVRVQPRRLAAGAAVTNSFGFGGHNVSLVVTS